MDNSTTRPGDTSLDVPEQFRKWFTNSPQEYVCEILAGIPELSPYEVASAIAWPELGGFRMAAFYASWKKELDSRITGYVYLLKGGGYYKIGRAKRPFERTRTLDIQLPFATELMHIIPCEDAVRGEEEFHTAFAEFRVKGEWFRLPDEEVDYFLRWTRHCNYDPDEYAPISRKELAEIRRAIAASRDDS